VQHHASGGKTDFLDELAAMTGQWIGFHGYHSITFGHQGEFEFDAPVWSD
jgi:hypothetical protein